jgi:hypothetical protein
MPLKSRKIFNVDEGVFPSNNKLPKIVREKAERELIKLTSAECGDNGSVVACYTQHFLISKCVRFRETQRADLLAASVAHVIFRLYQ